MRRWLRELDQHSAGLDSALADVTRIMREVADDPAHAEGELRLHLRQGADLIERLGEGQRHLIAFNRRSAVRFALLSALFTGLLAANVVDLFFR